MRMLISEEYFPEDGFIRKVTVEEEFQEDKPYKGIVTSKFIDDNKISESWEYEYINMDEFNGNGRVIEERWNLINPCSEIIPPNLINPCSEITLPPPVAKEFIKRHEMEI